MQLLRFLRFPIVVTVAAVIAAGVLGGIETALIVALLGVLEISISFDNAVVNATVLQRMSAFWQRIFLTWGILIAVFGMRLVFPILIVAAAAGLGVPEVVDQALNEPDLYAENLEAANPVIASFGGMFLLLVFLNFFLDDEKDVSWLRRTEIRLSGLGRVDSVAVGIAAGVLLGTSALVEPTHRLDVLTAGLAGILVYLLVSNLADLLAPPEEDEERGVGQAVVGLAGKAGLASFLYLEVLDASFSFDGVIGAFAISKDIVVITVGLGLGALYVRTLTVYLVRAGTLRQYVYLEHGAHWAIGVLAVILLVGIEVHVPEVLTALVGAALIALALVSSIGFNRREAALAGVIDPSRSPDRAADVV